MIAINNTPGYSLPRTRINHLITTVAQKIKIKKISLSLAFVNPAAIQKLNRAYRGLNRPTDVLSFCYIWQAGYLEGEIIICYDLARDQARKFGHSLRQELDRLLVHGLLHLVGYDHETESQAQQMERLENKLLKL